MTWQHVIVPGGWILTLLVLYYDERRLLRHYRCCAAWRRRRRSRKHPSWDPTDCFNRRLAEGRRKQLSGEPRMSIRNAFFGYELPDEDWD